jgi:hypothetical protein
VQRIIHPGHINIDGQYHQIIGREITVFILAALFLALMILPIYIDVAWMNDAAIKNRAAITASMISWVVSVKEVSCSASFIQATSAQRRPAQRGALTLVAGFYSCMLIRELDFVFDTIQHGTALSGNKEQGGDHRQHDFLGGFSKRGFVQRIIHPGLAVIAALFFIAAQRRPAQRGALTLVAGFYSCMLIQSGQRVQGFFRRPQRDRKASGSHRQREPDPAAVQKTLHALARLLQHRSWPVMASGFLVVLVFSRLFGIQNSAPRPASTGRNPAVRFPLPPCF